VKTLDKQQRKLKNERDQVRERYLNYLKSKGKHKHKKDSSGKRGGSAFVNANNCNCINASGIPSSGGSSGTSGQTAGMWASVAFNLKPTQAGFDGFYSISKFPSYDDDTEERVYGKVIGIEVRYGTSTVYNESSFNAAWAASSTYFSDGNLDGSDSTDITEDYWHWTPTLTSGYSYQQLVKVTLGNTTGSGSYYWGPFYFYTTQITLTTLSAPTVSFSTTTNLFTISSATSGTYRAVEFNRDSHTPYSAYLSSTETDICYNCSVRNHEYGIYSGQVQQAFDFALWDVGTYYVKLSYASAHPSGTRTRFSDAVDDWIDEMNTAISGSGISFARNDSATSPDILIETKSHINMGGTSYLDSWGYPVGGLTYAGLWTNYTDANGWIYYAYININYETAYYDELFCSVEAVVTEELTECCGTGGKIFHI
jgi:hypothetical protein